MSLSSCDKQYQKYCELCDQARSCGPIQTVIHTYEREVGGGPHMEHLCLTERAKVLGYAAYRSQTRAIQFGKSDRTLDLMVIALQDLKRQSLL